MKKYESDKYLVCVEEVEKIENPLEELFLMGEIALFNDVFPLLNQTELEVSSYKLNEERMLELRDKLLDCYLDVGLMFPIRLQLGERGMSFIIEDKIDDRISGFGVYSNEEMELVSREKEESQTTEEFLKNHLKDKLDLYSKWLNEEFLRLKVYVKKEGRQYLIGERVPMRLDLNYEKDLRRVLEDIVLDKKEVDLLLK